MAKFTKYNNPRKKHFRKKYTYSREYINERKEEMYEILARTEDPVAQEAIIKAFHASINP